MDLLLSFPPFEFLQTFLPVLSEFGPSVEAILDEPGFYPAGGGQISVKIAPCSSLKNVELIERGSIVRRSIIATVAVLPSQIGAREVNAIAEELGWDRSLGAPFAPARFPNMRGHIWA